MDKSQYQCIKAALNEVAAYQKDGYELIYQCYIMDGWWMRCMKHKNGNRIVVEMDAARTEMRVFVNGEMKKCQKFGV